MSRPVALVGPVLDTSATAEAVLRALRLLNHALQTVHRDTYVRVLARGQCYVTRAAIEEQLGSPFRLPRDLECIMPSFQGRLEIDEDHVRWFSEGDAS